VIGYKVSETTLSRLIDREDATWATRAKERTDIFKRNGRYQEKSSIWSEIKPVYMRLQGASKCAFCERKLESEEYGKGEQAIEHFRPKGKVVTWRPPASLETQGIAFGAVPLKNNGYYRLAYDLFNYTAACGPCNSSLKRNYFPIAGEYELQTDSRGRLRAERPYLIYPIGTTDDSPESLIEFRGASPCPVAPNGHARSRALVTIEFFRLDHPQKRKNLFRERAMILLTLYGQLEKIRTAPPGQERNTARQLIRSFTSPKSPHTNCARSFKKLYGANRHEAQVLSEKAAQFVISSS
jgi:hypothetical protein